MTFFNDLFVQKILRRIKRKHIFLKKDNKMFHEKVA